MKDCCQIIWRCLESPDAPDGMYNVGTGVGTTLEEQIRGIVEVFSPKDHPSPILYEPSRPDAPEYIFDVSKTRSLLGYEPQYSYRDYLLDFKREMEAQRFALLWGKEEAW